MRQWHCVMTVIGYLEQNPDRPVLHYYTADTIVKENPEQKTPVTPQSLYLLVLERACEKARTQGMESTAVVHWSFTEQKPL